MGVPTSEIGYNPAMPSREGHEVHKKDVWWHWEKHSETVHNRIVYTTTITKKWIM